MRMTRKFRRSSAITLSWTAFPYASGSARSWISLFWWLRRAQDVDKIRGLGFGADDYIEKPFSPGVLVARVKANLAQYKRLKPEEKPKAVLTVGDLTFDTEAHSASVRSKPLTLTNKEYELLLFLAKHPNQVFGREDLYELICGLESVGDNITVAVHINRLREKVELDPSHPQMIQTVWGVGYRLNAV